MKNQNKTYIEAEPMLKTIRKVLKEYYTNVLWGLSPKGTIQWPEDFTPPAEEEFQKKKDKVLLQNALNQTEGIIESLALDYRRKASGHADYSTVALWTEKAQRAKEVISGTASEEIKSLLQKECDARGLKETPEQLAEKQLKKSMAYNSVMVTIDGLESAYIKSLKKKKSINGIETALAELEKKLESELQTLV